MINKDKMIHCTC